MPMEKLDPRPNFHVENQQARNAEEALLAVLNTCAHLTKKLSEIEWSSLQSFGTWISRLQGQRISLGDFCLNCLSFLQLQNCWLVFKNFYEANLQEANLQEANLRGANLQGANLQEANLLGANLQGANLQEAYLLGANLQGANLQEANLRGANLQGANLQGTILEGKVSIASTEDAESERS